MVMWVKQGLVEQGMYRNQENTHLEWPDRTPTVICSLSHWKYSPLRGVSPTLQDPFPLRIVPPPQQLWLYHRTALYTPFPTMATVVWTRGTAPIQNEPIRISKEPGLRLGLFISFKRWPPLLWTLGSRESWSGKKLGVPTERKDHTVRETEKQTD